MLDILVKLLDYKDNKTSYSLPRFYCERAKMISLQKILRYVVGSVIIIGLIYAFWYCFLNNGGPASCNPEYEDCDIYYDLPM